MSTKTLSIVVPIFNEAASLPFFHDSLLSVCHKNNINIRQIIYCDDGSTDESAEIIKKWHSQDKRVVLLKLSRNFGKEQAMAAGIAYADSDAVITIDSDGQHPVELIPKFIQQWQAGSLVVIGLRQGSSGNNIFKRGSSSLFYGIYNLFSQQKMQPGTTDYCLMDKSVQQEFIKLNEPQRISRALVDWLGFPRSYVVFEANKRQHGKAAYSIKKLFCLSANGLVSMTPVPLYIFGIIGMIITGLSLVLGVAIIIEQFVLNDPLGWDFTGTAQLSILLLFLVGTILMSQGLLSLYISHIHNQTKKRPLYIIDTVNSVGLDK